MKGKYTELLKKFNETIENHSCSVTDDDYKNFETNKRMLLKIAEVENSSLTVYDMNKKHYVLLCSRFDEMIGYTLFHSEQVSPDQMFGYMHPDDIPFVIETSVKSMQYLEEVPPSEKCDYKLILDFRLINTRGIYVRFIQQMVVLELDKTGSIWLLLKIVDLVSENAGNEPSQRKLVNMKTGKFYLFNDDNTDHPSTKLLTNREAEILGLISQGMDSRQISERLFISVNTVNNHRQNILSKTKTGNTTQALLYAKRIGII